MNEALTAALYENNTWHKAEKVTTELPPPSDGKKNGNQPKKDLSDGAKAGIGIDAFIRAFALLAAPPSSRSTKLCHYSSSKTGGVGLE